MKLLIDIPEHIYEHAKERSEDSRDEGEAMRAIANGSPARCKGMNEAEKERLIKKDIASIENRVRSAFNQGYEMGIKESRSKIPNTCEDAISRQEALNAITMAEVRWQAVDNVNKLPSVSPHQRNGRWIETQEENEAEPFRVWECSECHCVCENGKPTYKYCPQCGAKMGVEE